MPTLDIIYQTSSQFDIRTLKIFRPSQCGTRTDLKNFSALSRDSKEEAPYGKYTNAPFCAIILSLFFCYK